MNHSDLRIRHICGFVIATDTPLADWLRPAIGVPDLTFRLVPDIEVPNATLRNTPPSYASPVLNADGHPVVYLYQSAEGDLFELPGAGEFLVSGDEILIAPSAETSWEQIELHFLNLVLPYWLESRGILALHASAVEHEGQAIAFLGLPGAGKSTLAAGLAHQGLPFLSDDLLPIELTAPPVVRPSMPTLRLSESVAAHLLGNTRGLKPVLPGVPKYIIKVGTTGLGSYGEDARPLTRVYLPQRRKADDPDPQIRIRHLSSVDALIAMVRHSSLPRIPTALGRHGQRLDQLTRLMPSVSFRHLSYPHGLGSLSFVCHALMSDQ